MWCASRVYPIAQWKTVTGSEDLYHSFLECNAAAWTGFEYWDCPGTMSGELPLLLNAGRFLRNGHGMQPEWLGAATKAPWRMGCLERVGEEWVDYLTVEPVKIRELFGLPPSNGPISSALEREGYRKNFDVLAKSGSSDVDYDKLYRRVYDKEDWQNLPKPRIMMELAELSFDRGPAQKFFSWQAYWMDRPTVSSVREVGKLWSEVQKSWELPDPLTITGHDLPGLRLYMNDPRAFYARENALKQNAAIFEEILSTDLTGMEGM